MMRIKMGWIAWTTVLAATMLSVGSLAPAAANAQPVDGATAATLCATSYPGVTGPDQLSPCQWDMKVINALAAHTKATGLGVKVGVIDGGIDFTHPDLAGAIDVGLSCSFINSSDSHRRPRRKSPTATALTRPPCRTCRATAPMSPPSLPAGRVNGVGIVGVAPEATIIGLKACTIDGFCFAELGGGSAPLCGRQAPRYRQPQSVCGPISIFLRQ